MARDRRTGSCQLVVGTSNGGRDTPNQLLIAAEILNFVFITIWGLLGLLLRTVK